MHQIHSAILGFTAFFLLLLCCGSVEAANQEPTVQDKVLATVGEYPITQGDLNSALTSLHAAKTLDNKAGPIDYSDIFQRLINTRLILLESKNMGLYDTPEMLEMVRKYSQELQMEMVLEEQVKDIKAGQVEVDRLYEDLAMQWRIKTLLIKKEEDAKKVQSDLAAGKDFDEVIKQADAEGIAKGGEEQFLKNADLIPSIAELVSTMEIGSVSPLLQVENKGFIIFKLLGFKLPEKEDAEALQTARQEALDQAKVAAAKKFYQGLKSSYVKVQKDLFDSIDYESKDPGFEKLKSDNRVVARIKGEKPVTVSDLAKAMEAKFYHGIENAIKEKKINKSKEEVLEGILEKELLLKESSKRGLEKSDALKKKVKAYEESMVFGLFVNKAINPDIKMTQEELKKYYTENIRKYTTPMMLAIKGLAFRNKTDAENNLNRLRKGTDFAWLSAHAEGQVESGSNVLVFDGNILSFSTLPKDLQRVLSGVKTGDSKLYADSEKGYLYLLYITKVISPEPQSFDKVKEEIAKEIFNDKQKKALEGWAEKLKAYYPVKLNQADLMKAH